MVQFNKRDLPDIKPLQDIRSSWGDIPTFPAVAVRGDGVIETFRELLRSLYRDLDARHHFAENFGVSEDSFLAGVFRNATPAERPAAATA